MKKLIAALILTTSISGIAAEVNVNVNPVINFNPTITVSPTITNTTTVTTNIKVNNDGRYSDDVSKIKNKDIRPLIKEIKRLSDKISGLQEKDEKLEKLVEILGKEMAKPIIAKKRKEITKEVAETVSKQISRIELLKKLEQRGATLGEKKTKKDTKGIVLFKTNNERKEWKALEKINPRLLNLIIKTAQFTKKNFNKPLVLTELHRTNEEQAALYGANYKKKSWHQFWSAVDFRSRTFTNAEILKIIDFLKKEFKNEGSKMRILYHKISGSVYHFHVTMKK